MSPNRVFLNDSMFRGTFIFLSIVARGDVPLLRLNPLRVPQIMYILFNIGLSSTKRAKASLYVRV